MYANIQQGKTDYSVTIKECKQQYLDFRKRDVELGDIVIGSFSSIAFRWVDLSV